MEQTSSTLNQLPLYAWSRARSLAYTAEFGVLNLISRALPGTKAASGNTLSKNDLNYLRGELSDFLLTDVKRIRAGLYPPSVLRPESPLKHFNRLGLIVADGIRMYRRRRKGRTTEFDSEAKQFLHGLPRYYCRNFHYQTNGYLSARSAELYEHQVELLFAGTADPMRRLAVAALKKHFGKSHDGTGLKFLELGCGTGAATRFVRDAFPKARIIGVDLSEPYLRHARRREDLGGSVDFLQASAEELPFRKGHFDAVFSVFLFHELPLDVRRKVFAETARVLKQGGFFGAVDSMQLGDQKQFDPLLKIFSAEYHEPYYRNYIATPLPKIFTEAGLKEKGSERGFFSRSWWGVRPKVAARKKVSSRSR